MFSLQYVQSPGHYQICGKPVHTAQKCWYISAIAHNEEEVLQALAAMTINDIPDPNQYADTGATTHATNNPGNLVSWTSYNRNDKFYIGDGASLDIPHTGKTIL